MTDDTPSATASLIARSLILLSLDPKTTDLVPPGAAEACGWFLAESSAKVERGERRVALWQALCRIALFRSAVYALEALTLPGILQHYALRKRVIEDSARRFLMAEPAGRVVVLGAGFDTLALRLSREYAGRFVSRDGPPGDPARQARGAFAPRRSAGESRTGAG